MPYKLKLITKQNPAGGICRPVFASLAEAKRYRAQLAKTLAGEFVDGLPVNSPDATVTAAFTGSARKFIWIVPE